MRVRVIDISGTPEELGQAQALIGWLQESDGTELSTAVGETSAEDGLTAWSAAVPKELRAFISDYSPNTEIQRHVMRFVGEVLLWGDTEVARGRSSRRPDGQTRYLMLRNTGPRRFGAFVYVKPSTGGATFRLSNRDVEPNEYLITRDVRSDNAYQVKCSLRSDEAVDEALKLARVALDRVKGR